MKEIIVKLPKIIKHYFRNTSYGKADFASPCNTNNFDGIESGSQDWLVSFK